MKFLAIRPGRDRGPARRDGGRRGLAPVARAIDSLEGRRLLSAAAPAGSGAIAPPPFVAPAPGLDFAPPGGIGPIPARPAMLDPLGPASLVASPSQPGSGGVAVQGGRMGPGVGPAGPPPGGHEGMSEATATIQGKPVTEVAIANAADGSVVVLQGSQVVFQQRGLDDPEAVKLADITDDGTPDLIVAESGKDRVLVYPGQAGGGFGAEVAGGKGYAVGIDPVGLTVGDLDADGSADLLVTNKGSNNVSVLNSHGAGAAWTLTLGASIKAGLAPFKTMLADAGDGLGTRDLAICNGGSGDVYCYQVSPDGRVGPTPAQVVPVGKASNDMFLGRFSRRPEMDLVTLDNDSGNVTFIGGVFSPHPFRHDIATGIPNPTSAFAMTVGAAGDSDLVVAGSGGQIAFLQAGEDGLVLTGLSAPTGLGNVTAIAGGETADGGLAIYEAFGGTDSVAILRFDLGDMALGGATPAADLLGTLGGGGDALVVEMVPTGTAMVDLAGILWSGANSGASADPGVATRTAPRSRPTGPGLGQAGGSGGGSDLVEAASSSAEGEGLVAGEGPASWTRFVLGLDAALDSFGGDLAAIAESDRADEEVDRSTGRLVVDLGDRPARAGDSSAATRWAGGSFRLPPGDDPADGRRAAGRRPVPGLDEADAPGVAADLTTAALGSAVAVRLLITASPPRPTRPRPDRRGRAAGSAGAGLPWPEVFPPMSPHG